MSHAFTLPPSMSISTALDINSQQTDIETLIFHATSLEAARKLMLFTEPRYVRELKNHEVDAVHRFFRFIKVYVERAAIKNAVYLGKTRQNRRVGAPLSNEPCVYLFFPHVKVKRDIYVERVLKLVIIPAFEEALQSYELPRVPTGAQRASPPVFRDKKDLMRGIMCHHEVRAYLGEDWTTIETAAWNESTTASR